MPPSITCRPGWSTAHRHRCNRASTSRVIRPQVVRDDNGIARGGIRLPQVEVPLAHNSAIQQSPDVFSRLVGFHKAFPVEKIRELYGNRDTYLDRYAEATRAAEGAAVILPRDVDPLLAEAVTALPL